MTPSNSVFVASKSFSKKIFFRRSNVFSDGTAEKTLTSLFEQEAAANSMQQYFQLEQVI